MLTNIIIKNFKRFDEVDVELGNPVVFIGPNNSGKTSALQALALWDIGIKKWNEKRKGKKTPEKKSGVAINRRDLIAMPVPDANLLWHNLHVRDVQKKGDGQMTRNVRVDIVVEGVSQRQHWKCGLEFDYANAESLYCRPLRVSEKKDGKRMRVPAEAENVQIAFLPPMSGLAASETRLDPGAINVRIGEGRTAEVLRNLCYKIYEEDAERWNELCAIMHRLFGAYIGQPQYIAERGEVVMGYRENGIQLDLSSAGRGLQQTLLIVAYMYVNPGAILLLDEPDAHLEILRQRQIYQLLTEIAQANNNQIIAASHSEVLLNEAADRDLVIAFLGAPHRIDDRGSQVMKSLREIGFEHYYQAEQTGWVLYLEGSTDLAILRGFAKRLNFNEAVEALERPYVHYVGNQPMEVARHFHGLREAVSDLKGIAIFDRIERGLPSELGAKGLTWTRREIENYICSEETLVEYAKMTGRRESVGALFDEAEIEQRAQAMRDSIKEIEMAMQTMGRGNPWDVNVKVSDDFLSPLFERYFKKLQLPNVMAKKNYHELVEFVPEREIDSEIKEKLKNIVSICNEGRQSR